MPTDGISGHLYVSLSVVCELATVQERARCSSWKNMEKIEIYSPFLQVKLEMKR
jgi:hypothetical protein